MSYLLPTSSLSSTPAAEPANNQAIEMKNGGALGAWTLLEHEEANDKKKKDYKVGHKDNAGKPNGIRERLIVECATLETKETG